MFYAMLKQRGRKTPKRWGNTRLLLHGVPFRYRKWVKLPEKFLNDTGLSDPEIFSAIAKSLASNYGLCIRKLGEDGFKEPVPPPDGPESVVANVGISSKVKSVTVNPDGRLKASRNGCR